MVDQSVATLDHTFAALAHPVRRGILAMLSEGARSVSELAVPFDMSLAAVSKHLGVLERAGLLRRTIDGRVHHCSLEAEPMREASDWIEHYRRYWEGQLDALAAHLEKTLSDRRDH